MKEFNKPTPVEEVKRERNYLQELNVRVDDAEIIKKPFFFLPRGDGQNNMLTETIEPYTNIVKDSINAYYDFTEEKSIVEYKLYQSNMFHDYLLSNINIILDSWYWILLRGTAVLITSFVLIYLCRKIHLLFINKIVKKEVVD